MMDASFSPTRWARIAEELVFVDGPLPVDVAFEARDHWAEVRSGFLEELTLTVAEPEDAILPDCMLPIFAMLLAAEKRDVAFAPVFLDLLKLPPDTIDGLLGETALTELLPRCIASVWHGDDEPLRAVAIDEHRDDFVRLAAIEAMKIRAMEGDADPATLAEFVVSLLENTAAARTTYTNPENGKARPKDNGAFFTMLLPILAELGATRHWPRIEAWQREGLIDRTYQSLDSLRETMFDTAEGRRARMFKPCYFRDTVEELSTWACFNEPERAEPFVRALPKVGRNDPCPCGSGRKYKKCCGAEA
jgi:Protein of unknown function (DUF1186)/SEC-C motif